MITIGANGQKIAYGIKHYNVDTAAELANLDPTYEFMGTTAFIIENSKYYMLNGSKQWIEISPFGESTGGGGAGDTIIYNGGVIH